MTATGGRPHSAPIVIPEKIPGELKAHRQWVLWRYEQRGGKWTKLLLTPADDPASPTDPDTWTTFDAAVNAYYHAGGWFDGLGFVDPETGVVTVWPEGESAGKGANGKAHVGRAPDPGRKAATAADAPKPRWPEPVAVTDLSADDAAIDFLWDGCVARRHITLLSALMKAGKTTLAALLLKSLQTGSPFFGLPTKQIRTLVVSEESKGIWCRRRDALGLDAHLSVLCRPLLAKPSLGDWREFVGFVAEKAGERAAELVVFDTISAFAPWRDENASAEVQAAVTPLNRLTEAGLAVLLFHHCGKTDQGEGKAARGSTALTAAADVLLEFRRFDPTNREDRRRVLFGLGRFDEVPGELVVELDADGTGYTVQGNRRAVAARDLADSVWDVLPSAPPGAKADDVHAAMPEAGRPRRGDVMRALQAGHADGRWRRGGSGRPHDPWRFWRGGS